MDLEVGVDWQVNTGVVPSSAKCEVIVIYLFIIIIIFGEVWDVLETNVFWNSEHMGPFNYQICLEGNENRNTNGIRNENENGVEYIWLHIQRKDNT